MDRKLVLYADNDRDYLDARTEFLEMEGYRVIKAYSPEEAEHALGRENIHLAILDIRLVDDNDEDDISGILLVKDERYKQVPKILVTGFPTFEAVRETYGQLIGCEPIAQAFLAKKEGPKPLIDAVKLVFGNAVGINWNLKIVMDEMGLLSFPYLALLLESELDPVLLPPRSSELEDLFRKLFFTDEQISIVRLNWIRNGCACLTLFALNEGSSRQAFVIFGRWGAVNAQHKQAEQYWANDTGLFAQPTFAESLRYSGLTYSIPDTGGGPLQTGLSFFHEAGDKNIQTALENLFRQTLHSWHQHKRSEKSRVDLAVIYHDRLGILIDRQSFEEVRHKVQVLAERARSYSLVKEISLERHEIEFVFTNGNHFLVPDPMAALFDPNFFNKQLAVVTSTFGGITAGSLLIDQKSRVYLTDMSSITRSPILEDFVSIECEFHFDRISSCNLLTLWDFEKQLGESKTLNDLPVGNVAHECRKALAEIRTVRELAVEIDGDALEPYLIGLFYYTINGLYLYDPQLYLTKYQVAKLVHRLMAASLIIAQIERLRRDEDGSKTDRGDEVSLRINETTREVSVDGREVQLTQTEFNLLLYLYKNPNRICNREEILSKAFEIKGRTTKSNQGLLNTHIDRLRKKIDINPSKHRYIVMIRGEGYLLDLQS